MPQTKDWARDMQLSDWLIKFESTLFSFEYRVSRIYSALTVVSRYRRDPCLIPCGNT